MKKILSTTVLFCAALLGGCLRNGEVPPERARVQLRLNGSLNSGVDTRGSGEGKIDPLNPTGGGPGVPGKGLPPKQLEVGIISFEYNSSTYPGPGEWAAAVPYLDRGFFGGDNIGDNPGDPGITWNGNIDFTNREGTAKQQVFYDLTGRYYYFEVVYPYKAVENWQDALIFDQGDAFVVFDIDGSHDIMATGIGSGNIDHPWSLHQDGTPDDNDVLVFSHKLACMRCLFIAENKNAAASYGNIIKVEVAGQPSQVKLNIGEQANNNATPLTVAPTSLPVNYAIDRVSTPMALPYYAGAYNPADADEFGNFLVMPSQTYTFLITADAMDRETNPVRVTYDFDTTSTAVAAGTVYYLTFKMLETHQIDISVTASTEWWHNQTFD